MSTRKSRKRVDESWVIVEVKDGKVQGALSKNPQLKVLLLDYDAKPDLRLLDVVHAPAKLHELKIEE